MYCEGMEDIPVFEEPDLIGDRLDTRFTLVLS